MSYYIKIDSENKEMVEEMLNEKSITYSSTDDPLYHAIESRIDTISSNMLGNEEEDLKSMLEFVYEEANPLPFDMEIMDKMIIYRSGYKEVKNNG